MKIRKLCLVQVRIFGLWGVPETKYCKSEFKKCFPTACGYLAKVVFRGNSMGGVFILRIVVCAFCES
ncbi:MAG: hypothetical protein PHG19_12320 [Anaerotignum sp.]|nr:hypothetical protein [Anaerotignum sp.]